MLTPAHKLESGVNDIIQIVITTACSLYKCSNCSQLLPFRKDYLHMSQDCFQQALDSLKGWPGVVALFGGNPCSHPNFPEICQMLAEAVPDQSKRGLWSNDFLRHGKVVRDTFYPEGRFNLNVHRNIHASYEMEKHTPSQVIIKSITEPAWHSPILVSWKDQGLTRDEWERLRESCDINQRWSAAIVERNGEAYAYFCEVAAALDGVRGQNMGLRASPGWWKLPITYFQGQIRHCCDAGCGIPLKLKGHKDLDFTYDVSKSMLDLVTDGAKGNVNITLPDGERTTETTDYMALRGEK